MNKQIAIFFFAIVSSFTASSAFANQLTAIPDGAMSLSFISGDLVSQEALCPEEVTCFTNGTVIDVRFNLEGCLDSLGPVTYTATETEDGRLVVTIAAINIHNRRSLAAFCYVSPTETRRISLINQYGDVELKFLDQTIGQQTPEPSIPTASISCHDNVDHGTTVDFYSDANGELTKAVYSETTFIATEVVREMPVCHNVTDEGADYPDAIYLVGSCNDTSWTDSYEVELRAGGFTGRPYASLYHVIDGQRELVKDLDCHNVQ